MKPDGIIFDFDGVLLESEYASNRHLAELLTSLGHPTSIEHALTHFTGLSGRPFLEAVGQHIGGSIPKAFHENRGVEDERALREGLDAVAGAIAFIRSLPHLPLAIASSSTTRWIKAHLEHLGLGDAFGCHIYSGHEHVEHGKPAPDIYLHAAQQIGVAIQRCAIIEDSENWCHGSIALRCAGDRTGGRSTLR
jgi:HAD superfamily hydrolase (TIGR01509 family)